MTPTNITPINPEVFIGDIGIVFLATVYNNDDEVVNIEDATNIEFNFKTSANEIISENGSFYTDGTDGKVQYISGDIFDVSGVWKYQVVLTFPNKKFHTNIISFTVYENIGE